MILISHAIYSGMTSPFELFLSDGSGALVPLLEKHHLRPHKSQGRIGSQVVDSIVEDLLYTAQVWGVGSQPAWNGNLKIY